MQARALVSAWISSEFAEDLEGLAWERRVSMSALVRDALSVFMYGEAIPQVRQGNRDGREDEAIATIKAHADLSSRKIVALLNEQGIQRGRDWVANRLNQIQREGKQDA